MRAQAGKPSKRRLRGATNVLLHWEQTDTLVINNGARRDEKIRANALQAGTLLNLTLLNRVLHELHATQWRATFSTPRYTDPGVTQVRTDSLSSPVPMCCTVITVHVYDPTEALTDTF